MITIATADDAEALAAFMRAVQPERVATAAGIRYSMETRTPEEQARVWKAEIDGRVVGRGLGAIDVLAADRTVGLGGVVVDEAYRGRGIGSALWEAVDDHLRAIGVRRLVARVGGAEPSDRRFAERRGFRLAAEVRTLALDPRTLDAPPAPAAGVDVRPMAAFADDPLPVYEVDRESALDEPGPGDASGITVETWCRMFWHHPDCDHELSVVVLEDGEVVGVSFLFTDRETGRAVNAGTGVVRAHRSRGLALLMKQHALAAAAASGITHVVTQNDETNAPMLAINERLGYRPFSVGCAWVLER